MSSTSSREAKANQILDRAEKMILGGKSKQEALDIMSKCWNGLSFALSNTDNPLGNALKNEADIVNQINKANKGNAIAVKLGNGMFGLVTGAGNAMINDLNGEDTIEKIIDMGANIVLSIWSLTPASRLANLANFLTGELFSYDASTLLKDIYKNFIGENVDLENTRITANGFLETIVDGVVYARPFMPNAQGSVFGNGKSDVLFGGSGKDIFIGHGGNDLFIGGDGKDDYFVNNSFITIKDSDGKGRVFDNNYKQLRGGTYSHSKNGEDKYFDGDTVYSLNKSTKTLHISSSGNGSVTIENFNKDRNDLDIVLLDPKDITVSISDNESSEGDSSNQSMKLK